MSLQSMTGCGQGQAVQGGLKVEVELHSVNRKQLDLQIHMPKRLAALESRIKTNLHNVLLRGRISAEISVDGSSSSAPIVHVDEKLAGSYVQILKRLSKELKICDDVSSKDLLALPGVLKYADPTEDVEKVWPPLDKALQTALRMLTRMRSQEGKELQKDLAKRINLLETYRNEIKKRAPQVVQHYRNELLLRLKKTGLSISLDDERLLRELAYFADRSDIAEELTRLKSHIKQFRQIMRSTEAAGRSLDFLIQEFLREINTIASKASDAHITKYVVAFKSELERIREQAQNIE